MPNVLSPRDLVSRPDNMEETVISSQDYSIYCIGLMTQKSAGMMFCWKVMKRIKSQKFIIFPP